MDENDKKFSPPLIFLFIMFSHSLNGLCSPTGRLFVSPTIFVLRKLVGLYSASGRVIHASATIDESLSYFYRKYIF